MQFFKTWIKQFEEIEKPIGDLARDMKSDHLEFPETNDYDQIHYYLTVTKNACYDAVATFEKAWKLYEMEVRL